MIKAKFCVHPVGQGLFYSGKFYHEERVLASIVYDCGTNTKNSQIQTEIERFKSNLPRAGNKKIINILVISHFDDDHINELGKLLENVGKIDYIILPAINIIEKLCLCLKNYYDNELQKLIINPIKYFDDKDIYVKRFCYLGDKDKFSIENSKNNETIIEYKDSYIFSVLKIWQFKFFTSKPSNKIKEIYEIHKSLFIEKSINIDKVKEFLEDQNQRNKLKKKYKVIAKNLNYTSLLMYHKSCIENVSLLTPVTGNMLWVDKEQKKSRYTALCFICLNDYAKRTGSLLLGDIMLKETSVLKIAKDLSDDNNRINDLFMVMAPHHGAKTSWQDNALEYFKSDIWIVNAGRNNNHYFNKNKNDAHPHLGVIKAITDMDKICIRVDENIESKFKYVYLIEVSDKCITDLECPVIQE